MRSFTDAYGAPPAHLAVQLACFAVAAYAGSLLLGEQTLLTLLVWFVGAALIHDVVLYPLSALADRAIGAALRRAPRPPVPLVNHVRVPLLGVALTFLMFLPGIIRQGGPTHLAATGLDQEPYLGRWLWLSAAMLVASAVVFGLRVLGTRITTPSAAGG